MKRIPLFLWAIVCLVFSYCRKDHPVKGTDSYQITIDEARKFFDEELANTTKLTKRHELMERPDWQHAAVKQAGGREVVVVPLVFKQDLTIRSNGDSVALSLQSLTKLLLYKKASDQIVSELVTTIPDKAFLSNKDAATRFTGMVWIEAWNGSAIGGNRYAADGSITGFELGAERWEDSLLKEADFEEQWCYVDFFYCVDASGYVTCRYNFSQAYRCGGGSVPYGQLPGGLYPVYGSGGGNGSVGSMPQPDATIGIGLNTVILAAPDKPIVDPYQYKRCFNRDSRNTYKIILYVDQPKAGTRALVSDDDGNTDLKSVKNDSKNFGHTWITFEEKRPNGAIVRRSLGFWPSTDVDLRSHAAPGILNDDGGRDYDVSLEIGLRKDAFFDLLDDCSLGNLERYNLNINNCTGWAIDKLYNNVSISLPKTIASWGLGRGEGPTPGNLGEDIRQLDLGSILYNSKVTSVKRDVLMGISLKNFGNCPISAEP
ncbi:hypothetical protein [uncultured Chitinophaga sp.]|jgi:hypothetical protein|uniref:hypothetical protein n=1 Tax=uncultured Chitinophaga sp. TaxID=339340 RepID=UPI002624A3E1|nr:hypothetical protein [uncultured Chitinophaga sp.]